MPLRFGVNFPAWFHPSYLPTAPVAPKMPQQVYFEYKEVLVQRVHTGGISVPKIMEILANYNSEDFFIDNADYSGDSSISIMKQDKYEVVVDEKEFLKLQKEYARNIKDYEKAESEYRMRIKKYPSMLFMHEDAKLRERLTKAEDEYEDAQLAESESQQVLHGLRTTIEETKKALSELREKNLGFDEDKIT